jgi:hypothetical protein
MGGQVGVFFKESRGTGGTFPQLFLKVPFFQDKTMGKMRFYYNKGALLM